MKKFKQEKSIVKNPIRESVWVVFQKIYRNLRNLMKLMMQGKGL